MGMYDNVNYTMPCPKCGAEVTGWQTKDMGENMTTYILNQLGDGCTIHCSCKHCKEWLDVVVRHVTPPRVRVEVNGYQDEFEKLVAAKHQIIVGRVGSGKSTLLYRLAQVWDGAFLLVTSNDEHTQDWGKATLCGIYEAYNKVRTLYNNRVRLIGDITDIQVIRQIVAEFQPVRWVIDDYSYGEVDEQIDELLAQMIELGRQYAIFVTITGETVNQFNLSPKVMAGASYFYTSTPVTQKDKELFLLTKRMAEIISRDVLKTEGENLHEGKIFA